MECFRNKISATEVDAELQALAAIIKQGWPGRRADVSSKLQVYSPFREELSIQDGVVFMGEQIVVPSSLRQCIMNKYMPVTRAFRGASGEPKKPSTGQPSTSKPQSSSYGAAFATATNQSSRKNHWYVTKCLHDHDRTSQQTCSSSMAPATRLQLTATLIYSSWIY